MNSRDLERMKAAINQQGKTMQQYISADEQAKVIGVIKDFQTRAYDKTKSYTNVVIVAGYTAFFTLWRSLKDDLPKSLMLASALLMVISVCLFITSEVYNMISDVGYHKEIKRILVQTNPQKIIGEIQEFEQKYEDRRFEIWVRFLRPTIATAVLGMLLFIGSFFVELVDEILPLLR